MSLSSTGCVYMCARQPVSSLLTGSGSLHCAILLVLILPSELGQPGLGIWPHVACILFPSRWHSVKGPTP